MEGESSSDKTPLILGRPFLKTAQTKIDVHAGILSMEFGDSIVRFNILDAMKHPMEEHSVFHIDLIDDLVNNSYADLCEEFPEIADFGDSMCGDLCASCDGDKSCSVCSEISAFLGYDESVPVLADCTTVELQDVTTKRNFKANGHRLKHFYDGFHEHTMKEAALLDATYPT
ncbi:hypothetical protein MRB53_020705 [Persea americana]|uniref:Uncharacterized protein n=1 Tax=Persea americana TaxID=3435 RepID=A0ACC2L2A7_PERAE|nr:hypothetical protein MRB53_020705 [Persea americana]